MNTQSDSTVTTARWFAVQTKPRQEDLAAENLLRQNYNTYLPHIVVRKRRKDKWVTLVEPLFPRYLFVKIDPNQTNIAPIRSTLGVSGLVRFGNEIIPIPDTVIEFLQKSENPETGVHDPNRPQFQKGEKVEILDGPFAGLEGIYQVQKGADRVLILINLLGRQNQVAIKLDDVAKL